MRDKERLMKFRYESGSVELVEEREVVNVFWD